jgi:spore maturation protein B
LPLNVADYILPSAVILITLVGLLSHVPLFDSFVKGATKALRLVASVFPYLAAVFLCVHLFAESGLQAKVCEVLSPLLTAVGIPVELTPLLIVKPLSGSGSLAVLEQIIADYGADSTIARTAAVLTGCSETVFYVAAVYLGTVKNKRLRYGLPVALACTLFGAVVSCWICRVI